MLPALPAAFDPAIAANPFESSAPCPFKEPVDHHCQICPTCSHQLTSHRCKLVCTHCGYYLSCADYY